MLLIVALTSAHDRAAGRSGGSFLKPQVSKAFTLIELLVVIAIIAILAAILFPVFSQARDKARSIACLSNTKQMATAVEMYIEDYDERQYFRPAKSAAKVGSTRSGVAITNTIAYDAAQWWNLLQPYIKNVGVFSCPSDGTKPLSPDVNGNNTIPRSFVASCTAEDLTLAQVDSPVTTIVITEKWGYVDNGIGSSGTTLNNETWMEPFDGDECQAGSDVNSAGACTDPQPGYPTGMVKMANRHQNGMNNVFFDGHAKWLTPGAIWQSADLTGCTLIHQFPSTQPGSEVCDQTIPGCAAPLTRNICNVFFH
jgi:prepilin-type N-terminal cleavage/methylation domain-containing protein/prepilin-type processing-associated H-X9-DG protein